MTKDYDNETSNIIPLHSAKMSCSQPVSQSINYIYKDDSEVWYRIGLYNPTQSTQDEEAHYELEQWLVTCRAFTSSDMDSLEFILSAMKRLKRSIANSSMLVLYYTGPNNKNMQVIEKYIQR